MNAVRQQQAVQPFNECLSTNQHQSTLSALALD